MAAVAKGGVPQMVVPNSWMVDDGKYHLEIDDDWGYPHFRKPSKVLHNLKPSPMTPSTITDHVEDPLGSRSEILHPVNRT